MSSLVITSQTPGGCQILLLFCDTDWAAPIRASWNFSEDGGYRNLQLFLRDNVGNYNDESGRCDLPNTSQISPYLHFGQISPRTVLSECYHLRKRSPKYLRFEHAISTEIQILARIESQMPCNSLFLLKSIFCLLPLGFEYFEDSFQTCFLKKFLIQM